MKAFQSSVFRAVIAIAVGALLVKYREDTVTWLTIAVGVLFFFSGLISCAVYYGSLKSAKESVVYDDQGKPVMAGLRPAFPIVGVGSMILGVILALMPVTFVNWIVIILGVLLILCTIGQFFTLARASRFGHVPFLFWTLPALLMLVGIYAIQKPMDAAATPLFIIGWAMMVYGVVECINALKIHRLRKDYEKQIRLLDKAIDEAGETPSGSEGEKEG